MTALARHGYDNGNNRHDERNNRNDNRPFRDPPICFGGIWGRAQSRRHCSDRRDAVIENVTSAAILRFNSLPQRVLKTSLISNICFIEHDVSAEVDPGGISLRATICSARAENFALGWPRRDFDYEVRSRTAGEKASARLRCQKRARFGCFRSDRERSFRCPKDRLPAPRLVILSNDKPENPIWVFHAQRHELSTKPLG